MTALQIRLEIIWPSFRDDLENIRKKSQRARWGYNHLYSRKFVNKLMQLEDAIDENDALTIMFSLLKLKNDIEKAAAAAASLPNTSSTSNEVNTDEKVDEGIEVEQKAQEDQGDQGDQGDKEDQEDKEKKHQKIDKAKQVRGPGYSTITFIKCYLILNKQYSEQGYMIRIRGIIEKKIDEYQSYLGSMKPNNFNKKRFMGLRELLSKLKEEFCPLKVS